MKTYRYSIGMLPNIVLPLGIQGENGARQSKIDYTEWITEGFSGVPHIEILMPNGTAYSPNTSVTTETDAVLGARNILLWTLTSVDTSDYGVGLARIILFGENDMVLKSSSCRTMCEPSMARDLPDAPDVFQEWMQRVMAKAATIEDSVDEAVEAADSANTDAWRCEQYAMAMEGAKPTILDGLMNLTTSIEIEIGEDDWEYDSETEKYSVTLTNPIITEDTAGILMLGEADAEKCQACIEMDTGDGTITFSTSDVPTDDISGTLILQGRFADGGVAGITVKKTLTINPANWSNANTVNCTCAGMKADSTVFASPTPASMEAYLESGVFCYDQGTDTLSFKCKTKPSSTLYINVLAL